MKGDRPAWFPNWQNEYAAVVAAGPSLTQADVDKLRDRIHVIAVNTTYRLCPWADVLYGCDVGWWKTTKGAPEFKGLKIGFDIDGTMPFEDVKKIKIRGWERRTNWVNDILVDNYGEIGAGANSAFQACNLAVQFGVKGILLLALDMCQMNGKSHWHGQHPYPLNNPIQSNFSMWKKNFEGVVPTFSRLGIDVVNCTMISALSGYPKMSIEDAFKRWNL